MKTEGCFLRGGGGLGRKGCEQGKVPCEAYAIQFSFLTVSQEVITGTFIIVSAPHGIFLHGSFLRKQEIPSILAWE